MGKVLTVRGKQVIREIALNKFKKPFSKLTPTQKKTTATIFMKRFVGKRGNIENKLRRIK